MIIKIVKYYPRVTKCITQMHNIEKIQKLEDQKKLF